MSSITERLKFLFDKFDVFDSTELELKIKKLKSDGYNVTELSSESEDCLAIVSTIEIGDKLKTYFSVSKGLFDTMVDSDPTPNKIYTQWMLNTLQRLLKTGKYVEAIRFSVEDLPLAKEYLLLFDNNKRKQKFKNLCKGSYILKDVSDPTDINQYKSLGQLYDAIDPFIIRDASEIEELLYKFVDSGQAKIGVRDRKYTVYVPLTRDASVIFESFANWCTCKTNNGMFKHYTTTYKIPNGQKSNIFIIINNDFFNGIINDDSLYQIHFESNQVKDRKNDFSNTSIFEKVLVHSDGLSNYFQDVLINLSRMSKVLNNNTYLNHLIKFGFSDSLFEVMEETTPIIIFKDREVPKMGDLSRFKYLSTLEMNNTNLTSIHTSVCSLMNLEVMVVRDNKITELPKEIGNLKNLMFLNILGNKITEIPDTIKYLDKSNGGKLYRVAASSKDIGDDNYQKLKRLLPNTQVVDPQ
jgi:hypothetical protein